MRVSRNVGVTSSLGLAFILHLSSSIFFKKKKKPNGRTTTHCIFIKIYYNTLFPAENLFCLKGIGFLSATP